MRGITAKQKAKVNSEAYEAYSYISRPSAILERITIPLPKFIDWLQRNVTNIENRTKTLGSLFWRHICHSTTTTGMPMLTCLNGVFPKIQLTIEEKNEHTLSRDTDGDIHTSVFRQATDTEQVLHFGSDHPAIHKRSCVGTPFDSISTHCSTCKAKQAAMRHLRRIFLGKGHSPMFIRITLHGRRLDNHEISKSSAPK